MHVALQGSLEIQFLRPYKIEQKKSKSVVKHELDRRCLIIVFYLYFVSSAALQSGADAEVNGLAGSRVKRDVHV